MKPQIKLDQKTTKRLEEQHARVQAQIASLPEGQQKIARASQKLVDAEIDKMNDVYFNDGMFAVDKFLIDNGIAGTQRENFIRKVQSTSKGSMLLFDGKAFVRTYDDNVVKAQDYMKTLELTIVEQVQYKEVKYVTRVNELDKLGFVDLIKLAFKRLFKKGENNG